MTFHLVDITYHGARQRPNYPHYDVDDHVNCNTICRCEVVYKNQDLKKYRP